MPESRSSSLKLADSIVRYAAILFAFLVPVFVIPAAWVSVPQSKALLAALLVVAALIAWLVHNVIARRVIFSFDPILIAALLLPVAYGISAFVAGASLSSYVSGDALTGTVAGMLLLFGAALLGTIAVENKHTSLGIVIALLASGALLLVFQALRIFFPESLNFFGALPGNTSSIIGSWHDLAIFAGLMALLAYGLLETSLAESRPLLFLLHGVGLLALFSLLIVNFSDAWFALAAGSALFALSRTLRAYRRERAFLAAVRSALLWLGITLVGVLIALYGSFVYENLPAKLQISQTEVRPSWQGTFAAGEALYEGGKALVFGSGPNTFDRQWARFKPQEVNATNFWNTEFQYGYGVVPTAFITVGVVGTLVWALLALALLFAGYRSFRDESEGRLRVILFIVSAYLLAYHIIYVPSIGVSLLMFLLLGVLAGLNAREWRAGTLSFEPRSMVAFVLVLALSCVAIAGALMESRAVVSSLYVSRAAAVYQATGDISAASALVVRAVEIDPKNDVAQRAAVQIGILQFGQLAQAASSDSGVRDELQRTLSSTIAHGLSAVSIDDTSYQNWLALAGLYQSLAGVGIEGAYEQAETAWLRAASTTPNNPLPFVQLGQLSMTQGKNAQAVAYFSKAIALKPNLALPYYLRAQIEAGEQKWEQAVTDAYTAAQIANQDPLSWYTLGIILYAAGDNQNAAASLEQAVSLQNNYSDALFALTVVYDKLGERERALATAQKVVELNPQDATAAQVLSNIQDNKPAMDGLQGQPTTPSSQSVTPEP